MAETLRWQYQVRGEPTPVSPIIPDFGWFVQETDVVRPPHQTQPGGMAASSLMPLPGPGTLGWASETTVVLGGEVFQYPSREAGSPEPITAITVPEFGWFVQESVPVFVPPRHPEQALAQPTAEHASIIPDYDWFLQETDVVRAPHQVRPGMSVLGEPPAIPDFGWFVAPPDVIRPPHQTRPGYFVSGRVDDLITVDLDWFVQDQEQVFGAPHQVRLGLFVLGQPPSIPAFDWFHQQADVTRPPHQTQPGASALVEFGVPVLLDIDWLVQETPIFRAPHQTRPGLAVLGQPPTIPDFDWFLQQADIIRPPHQTQPGYSALVEFGVPVPPIVLDIDWLVQETPIFRAPHQVRPGLFVIGQLPTIPDLAWYNQYPEQFLPEEPRPYYYPTQEFRTELPFPVTLDQWWQQASEPVRTIPPVEPGLYVLVDIEDVALIVYSQDGWPFLALINPADHPVGTQFFFEVILATDNGAIITYARLFNLTTAAVVAGSTLSTAVIGLGDRLRTAAPITLAAGDNEYKAERGDASGTTHARLYEARIVVVRP